MKLQDRDKFFLKMFLQLLESNSPREVFHLQSGNTVIFTDACYERDLQQWACGLGGVICFGKCVEYFSLELDARGRETLGEMKKKQIIFEAETLAAVIAFAVWKHKFANERCLFFVDNEGTKFSLLKGSSDNPVVDLLAGYFAELEVAIHAFTWISRVPSKSNIADPPSRNDVSSKFFERASKVSAEASAALNWILDKLKEDGGDALVSSHHAKRCKRS